MDHADCSWTPAGHGPVWAACPLRFGDGSFSPSPLAHRHHLYVVAVRGTDDFGRSTVASGEYDPVPCALAIRRPSKLSGLLFSGVRMRVSCDTLRRAEVGVYAYALNGRRYASPRGAVSELPQLGRLSLHSATPGFTVRRLLRLSGRARRAFRKARSLSVVFAAGAPDTIQAGIADDTLSLRDTDASPLTPTSAGRTSQFPRLAARFSRRSRSGNGPRYQPTPENQQGGAAQIKRAEQACHSTFRAKEPAPPLRHSPMPWHDEAPRDAT